MSKFCPQCGRKIDENTFFCPYCEARINQEAPVPPGVGDLLENLRNIIIKATPGQVKAVASLVLGIIACFWGVRLVASLWFRGGFVIQIAISIVGICLAYSALINDRFNSGYRTAGWVLSLLGLIFSGVNIMEWIVFWL